MSFGSKNKEILWQSLTDCKPAVLSTVQNVNQHLSKDNWIRFIGNAYKVFGSLNGGFKPPTQIYLKALIMIPYLTNNKYGAQLN